MAMPSPETEEWRYSPVGELDLAEFVPQVSQPVGPGPDRATPIDHEAAATVVIIDGHVAEIQLDQRWASKGLQVGNLAVERPEPTAEDTKLDVLHLAFAPDPVRIVVPDGLFVDAPIVVHNHLGGTGIVAFPHIVIEAGASTMTTVIERQTSSDGAAVSIGRTEISVGSASTVEYFTLQELGRETWNLSRIHTTVADQATSRTAVAAFGGSYSRVRTDTDLAGTGAHGDLAAVYYADGDQTLDFRTYQHHRAPKTTSDLLFKGASDDHGSSIYTGMIHIHEEGAGSNAHQTNRNIKLSEDAWAWSVPNLEIENNDVRCSHASTVSPIDVDQLFYLHARGVPPGAADRLVVAGFFAEVLGRFRSAAVQSEVRALIEAKLDARARGGVGMTETTRVRLCALDDLVPETARRFDVGDRRLAVVRLDHDVFVIGDRCSHADFSLSEGEVDPGERTLECPKHGAAFSLASGEPECLPATRPVPTYDVEIVDGDVIVTVP